MTSRARAGVDGARRAREARSASPALRPVGPADAALLAALQDAAFAAADSAALWARRWSPGEMAGLLAAPATVGRLAVIGEDPGGFILAQAAGGEAEILTLAVRPERRRLGLGTRLIGGALDDARARGAGRLLLEVAVSNAAARAFYARLGFKRIGLRRKYYTGGPESDDALILAYNLYA